MCEIEEMPLFIEDTISQKLIHLFHDTTMAQNYHFLSTPLDLPAEYGVPLRLTLAHIPEHTLSLLHLHGFHTFITCISPTLIYPTFCHIFFTMSMGERDRYITQAELLHPRQDSSPLMIPPPSSSVNTSITELHAWISSPPLSEISETPMAVESTISSDGIDTDARMLIQSYNITLPLGQHVLIRIASSNQVQRQQQRDEPVRENTYLVLDTLASRLRSYHSIVGVESFVFRVIRTQLIYIQSIVCMSG